MLVETGYFNKLGDPCIKFHICGVFHPLPGMEFEAVIDTGFTGFLSFPIIHAFSLGLPLHGTTSATLADGSSSTCLTALGKVTFGIDEAGNKETKIGVVMLEAQSQEILVGLDFLRKFKLALLMTKSDIMLFEEDFLDKAKAKAAESKKAEDAAPTPDSSSTALEPP